MARTLVQQIRQLLDEAKKLLGDENNSVDAGNARDKILACHTLLSQTNGFMRASKDFLDAKNLYQQNYSDLEYALLERNIDLDPRKFKYIIPLS